MAKHSSNTTTKLPKREQPAQLKGKGFDAHPERINRNGRPKSFDQVRSLFQSIAGEEITVNGKKYTRAQAIGLAMSADKKLMRDFLEYAFGSPPKSLDVTSGGKRLQPPTVIEVVRTVEEKDNE